MRATAKYQVGLSIIELMIAVALSSMLLFGVIQIFDANRESSRLTDAYGRVQESGRISLELVSRDIRMADYWGCAPDSTAITSHLDTSDADYAAWMNPEGVAGVEGTNNVGAGVNFPGTGVQMKTGTDTLTLRGSKSLNDAKVITPYMPNVAAVIQLTAGSGIQLGDVIMISDCTGADVFTNTANNTDSTGTLQHNTGVNSGAMVQNATQPLSHTYDGTAQISRPYVIDYFAGDNGAGGFSLYRRLNGSAPSEMVRDIEDLQFEYGEDTNDDGAADIYRTANNVANMGNVVSIRISATFASSTNVVNGAPLTRVYSLTSNIRNRTL